MEMTEEMSAPLEESHGPKDRNRKQPNYIRSTMVELCEQFHPLPWWIPVQLVTRLIYIGYLPTFFRVVKFLPGDRVTAETYWIWSLTSNAQ